MKRALFLIAACFIFYSSYAGSDIDIEKIKSRYAKYNAVILNQDFNFLIDVVHDSLVVTQTNSKRLLIINEHSKGFTNDYIYYNTFTNIQKKEAYTLIPKGKKYDKVEANNFIESHNIDGSVFYDDSKTIQFSYPALQEGAIASLDYTINYNNPRFIRMSYLQSYVPIINSKIRVKIHRDVKVDYKLFNDNDLNINFKEYSQGKYRYLEWEVNNVEPFKYLSGKYYSIPFYSPHVAIYINETNINGQKKKYFGTINDLYQYYQGFISEMNKTPSSDLELLVNNLTVGLSDKEKMKAIYYWVQNNIKYVAYEQGYLGLIPSSATEVFTKRFGDCKGMSSLIIEMMNLCGLSAHYTWVGTRRIPYSYNEFPLPAVDNHMIATYLKKDSVIILDGTFKYLDYGIYPYNIQGKELMIGLDKDQFKIFKVPVSPASYSVVFDSANISLSDNTIIGKAKRIHKGFNKGELAYAMDGVKENDYNKSFSKLLNKGSNKFKVENHQVINLFKHDIPAEVDYEFVLHDYIKKIQDNIYVNLNLDKSYQALMIDTSSIYGPIENDFYLTESFITRFEIPKGYEISFIPEDGEFDYKEFRFSIKYRKEGNFIIQERVIVFEFLVLLEDKISKWNEMIKQLSKQYKSSVVLKKIDF